MSNAVSNKLILLIVGLALIVSLLGWSLWQRQQLTGSSSEFTLRLLEQTLAGGSPQLLLDSADEQLLAEVPATALTAYVELLIARLGPLQGLTTISGDADIPALSLSGNGAIASYQLGLDYGDHMATALIGLRHDGNEWRTTSFSVESNRLYN